MSTRLLVLTLVASVMLSSFGTAPAISRMWKVSPIAMAQDYATINDNRGHGDVVLLMWFVPQMVAPGSPGADTMVTMLRKYVVVMVGHGHLDTSTGRISFDDIGALQASDQDGRTLTPVARNDLPPVTNGALTTVESIMRQALGTFGSGMKMFAFDAGHIDTCSKGRLSIPLAGETYTWDTPIPGCQQN